MRQFLWNEKVKKRKSVPAGASERNCGQRQQRSLASGGKKDNRGRASGDGGSRRGAVLVGYRMGGEIPNMKLEGER